MKSKIILPLLGNPYFFAYNVIHKKRCQRYFNGENLFNSKSHIIQYSLSRINAMDQSKDHSVSNQNSENPIYLQPLKKKSQPGIYRILNKKTKCVYIGETNNVSQRVSNHKNRLKNNRHSNKQLQADWNFYDKVEFEFDALFQGEQWDNQNKRLDQQNKLIQNCQFNCYNCNKTKTSDSNPIPSKKLRNNKNLLPGVYIVYSEKHKTCYIGESKRVATRLKEHRWDMLRGDLKNNNFRKHYKQCNLEDFKFEILSQGPEFEKRSVRRKEEVKWMKQKEKEGFQLYNEHRFSSYKGTNNPNAGKKSINAIKIEIKGTEYKSIREASLQLNIPFRKLYYRLKSANFPDYKGLDKLPKTQYKQKIEIEIEGIKYPSISEASRLLEVSYTTIARRLKSAKFSNYKRIDKCARRNNQTVTIKIKGIQYNSMSEACRKLDIKLSTLYYRLASSEFPDYKRIIGLN